MSAAPILTTYPAGMQWTTHIFTSKPESKLDGVVLEGDAYAGLDLRSPPRQLAHIEATSSAQAWDAAAIADLAEFWCIMARTMARCLPTATTPPGLSTPPGSHTDSTKPFTSVFVEIRADGGSVAASLRDGTDELRRIPCVVCINLPFFEEAVFALPDPDDADTADAFDAGMRTLLEHARDALVSASTSSTAAEALVGLCREAAATSGGPLRVELHWSDDPDEHIVVARS